LLNDLIWVFAIEAHNEPFPVVTLFEFLQGLVEVLDVLELPNLEKVLFQGPEETFNTTVAFR
jgi:hypothetical protein